jgi:probable HAF family extracellular repeat protein
MVAIGSATGLRHMFHLTVRRCVQISFILCLPMFNVAVGQEFSFTPLGDLPGGLVDSYASDVSANGAVIVGASQSAGGAESFRWTADDGMVGLGVLPDRGPSSQASAVSADGLVVVGSSSLLPVFFEAFRWTSAGGMVAIDTQSGRFSAATSVSADGSVIVGFFEAAPTITEGFRWTENIGIVAMGDLPGGPIYSDAQSISADGSVIVGRSESASGLEAFRWTSSTGMVGLGDLPGGIFESEAYDASADGSVIVGVSNSGSVGEAFRWTGLDGMVGLGDLPGGRPFSAAYGVSANGSVVVGRSESEIGAEAFIWTSSSGMQSLRELLLMHGVTELTDWKLDIANAISADGRTIVGYGFGPTGRREAWAVTIPEPLTIQLIAVGFVVAFFSIPSRRSSLTSAAAIGQTTSSNHLLRHGPFLTAIECQTATRSLTVPPD